MTDSDGAEAVARRTATRAALIELGTFVADLDVRRSHPDVLDALKLVLVDTIGVTVAGARTPELQALNRVFPDGSSARPLGTDRRLELEACAFLDGTASCILELDEGNKHARGHPMAHVLPVALAVAQTSDVTVDELLAAVVAGHEVAARFGRAVRLAGGVHPHGNWGVTGAAAAAARLLGCDAEQIAGAIDAAAGYALAVPFDAALEGTFVRNTWMGVAATSGLQAARSALAGLTDPAGTAATTFGRILGSFEPGLLTEELGSRFDLTHGYLKLHASCSYTHPPIDATLLLRERHGIGISAVAEIEVRTHGLAAPLDRTDVPTRLAAQFSIPYLVAAALDLGAVDSIATGAEARSDAAVLDLARRVKVVHDPAMDRRAPRERPARVVIRMRDGAVHEEEVPNPVGDADHQPLDRARVRHKLTALLDEATVSSIEATVESFYAHGEHPAAAAVGTLP